MQDIIPPKKRSIKDIPIPDGKSRNVVNDFSVPSQPRPAPVQPQINKVRTQKEIQEILEPSTYEDDFEEVEEESVPARRFEKVERNKYATKGSFSKRKIIFFTTLAFAFIFTVILVSRESAKVYVYARELTQSANVSITQNYTVEKVTSEKTVSVKATGEEQVTEKAKGKITIYNEYEEKDQRLLKETRFESSNGLIYRIPMSVVVPALKRDDKGNVIPGKLEVEVVADEAGEKYNIGAGKFTVPGFKDLPQYESFYAVSENPMTGGFDGIKKVISETDRQEAEKTLKNQLRDELIAKAREKTSGNNLVLADETMITYEILGDKVDGNNVSISARGTIEAVSVDFQSFSNSVAKSIIPQFSDLENVEIKNIKDLSVSVSKKDGENSANMDVSGSIEFLWKNDHEALKVSLAGTNKNDIEETGEMFPGITKISAEVSPFWSKMIPSDVEKIKIIDSKN